MNQNFDRAMQIVNKFDFYDFLKQRELLAFRKELTTLQVNIGKLCNQTCIHCHVDADPSGTENMDEKTAQRVLQVLTNTPSIKTVDITGGAPELNPNFRYMVKKCYNLGKKIIDRCNLTVMFEAGQEDLGEFLAENQVEITASMPCYLEENVDTQRGKGVFEKSIKALKNLNALGYGKSGTDMILNLVFNPGDNCLPPSQTFLENQYKKELKTRFNIEFNTLLTITNMPVNRLAGKFFKEGLLEDYMNLLVNSFNPATIENLMCNSIVSVAFNGGLYDCDFNQMLNIHVYGKQKTIYDIDSFDDYKEQRIARGGHCFGCTAGAGSG